MTSVLTRPLALSVVGLLFLSLSSPLAQADHTDEDTDEVVFEFSSEHGLQFTDELNLTGTSTVPLRNTSWSIVNISGPTPTTVLSGPYLTSVQPVDDEQFAWQLLVDVTGYDCTCYVHIDIEDEHLPYASTLLVYLGDALHRPAFLEEVSMGLSPGAPSDSERIEGGDVVYTSGTAALRFGYVLPPTGTTIVSVQADICEAPFGVCTNTSTQFDVPFVVFENEVVVSFNPAELGLGEGVWHLDVTAKDDLLRTTGKSWAVVLYDTQPPLVSMALPPSVNESEPLHVYASVSDGYTGSSFTYTWALVLDTGERRAPHESEVVSDEHLIFNLSNKGIYTVELSVRDRAGYVSQASDTFTVLNIRPTAHISIDGLVVEDNGRLSMQMDGDWELNASQSFDNEGVDFLWVINDDRSVRGTPTLPSSEFSQDGQYRVELIVFDDDGETHSTVIEIDVLGVESEEPSSISFAFALFFLFLTVSYVAYRSRSAPTAELPKWTASAKDDPRQSHHRTEGFDATIEEDQARG